MSARLTVDGRQVEVGERATILDAARKLGIVIPTLCHADGLRPAPSCFLCVVQVQGEPHLVPSCVVPAQDGMVVTTDSDDIRAARRTALELLLSDHAGDCEGPCTLACPAGVDIPELLRCLVAGRYGEAAAVMRERIPLPGALSRICPGYCERVCRRGERDEAVAIRALTRFVADTEYAMHGAHVPQPGEPTDRKVAIVGAGPAGLSAAYYLLLEGHGCTLFDQHAEPGGNFRYGLPSFRLPRGLLDVEIDVIRKMGARFRLGTRLGEDVALDDLRREYDAVLLAMGAGMEAPLGCEGGELALSVLEFLCMVSEGAAPHVGGEVVVLGDGKEAVDAARTAVRLGTSRVALLAESSSLATPFLDEHLASARAEGVEFVSPARPTEIVRVGDGRFRVACQRDGGSFITEASVVISAQKRSVDLSLVRSLGLAVSQRGIEVERETLRTGLGDVFAAGEAVSGSSWGVRAVAAGRLAALCIHQYLCGAEVAGEHRLLSVRMGQLSEKERAELFRGTPERAPVRVPGTDMARRKSSFGGVEGELSEPDAVAEAERCLHCDCEAKGTCKLRRYASEYGAVAGRFRGERRAFERDVSHPDVVYEPGKCILCGLCVRIAEAEQERLGMTFARRGFVTRTGVPFGGALQHGLKISAERCAAACPTGALALRRRMSRIDRASS